MRTLTRLSLVALMLCVVGTIGCKNKLVDDGSVASNQRNRAPPTTGDDGNAADDPNHPNNPNPTPGDDLGHGDEWDPIDNGMKDPPPDDTEVPVVEEPVMMRSEKNALVWKRQRAVERDLMNALALNKNEVCAEVGTYACVDRVHLAPLGGNEPFEAGQYAGVPSPTATTSTALERVVLSACAKRVEKDAAATPVVFTALDLDGPPLDANNADHRAIADATVTSLYRRLLARDPLDTEIESSRALLTDGDGAFVPTKTFAVTACFAIGTTVENFFY